MEYKRLDLTSKDLQVGDILFAVKSGDYYKLTEKGTKYTLEQINGADVKNLSKSTMERWYRLVVDYEQPSQQTEDQQPENEPIDEPQENDLPNEESQNTQPETQEIEPEIQPATPPVRTTRRAPNSQAADPVLQQLRQRIIDKIIEQCPNAVAKETSSYTGLKVGKYNFGEVGNGKRRFTIRVMSKALNADALAICNIAPPSYGWTLDASYTILTDEDFDNAVSLLKQSYAYRLVNTPSR